MSESYCCKVYQKISRYLLRILSVSGRKALLDGNLKAIAIDVTEQPIECPVIGQQDYFSEKKQHTIKVQLIICLITLKILMVYCAKETVHDFKILKNSRVAINGSEPVIKHKYLVHNDLINQ